MPITLNGTTGIIGPDGSAATPAIQGSDNNTGMFFPAADTIAFAEGGTEVMRIDSSGNLGIGTSSPAGRLSVQGSASASAVNIDLANNAAQAVGDAVTIRLLTSSAFVAAPTAAPYISAIQTNASTSTTDIAFGTFNGTSLGERVRIDSTGNFSITQTPGKYTVDVTGGSTSIANGGTVDFPNASGMLVVNNYSNGNVTIYLCGGGVTAAIGSVGGQVGTLSYVGGIAGYRWANNYGSTATFGFFFVRTRPTA